VIASPSEDTISPVYSGCRTHRYGPPTTSFLACAITDRLRPRDRSDHTDHPVPTASSMSPAHCAAAPGGVARNSGNANGASMATTAAAWAVTDRPVAMAGPRRR
jgi:hypothetical protein